MGSSKETQLLWFFCGWWRRYVLQMDSWGFREMFIYNWSPRKRQITDKYISQQCWLQGKRITAQLWSPISYQNCFEKSFHCWKCNVTLMKRNCKFKIVKVKIRNICAANSSLFLSLSFTLWFQKNVMAGKKIVWVENGLNIGNRASGLGLNIKDMDVLLSALKNLEIIQF